MNADTIQLAWNMASVAHNGQYYINNQNVKLPYLNHIGAVVNELFITLLKSKAYDMPVLITCAILHDVLEDTPIGPDEIEAKFGTHIARGVQALTKDTTIDDKKLKMLDSLSRINAHSKEAAMVKMADRIVNLQPPPHFWDTSKIKEYYEESLTIHKALQDSDAYLADRLKGKIRDYRRFLEFTP